MFQVTVWYQKNPPLVGCSQGSGTSRHLSHQAKSGLPRGKPCVLWRQLAGGPRMREVDFPGSIQDPRCQKNWSDSFES